MQVKCVRMRRHLTSKDFKGSVFVEFADKETAGKVQNCCSYTHCPSVCSQQCVMWQSSHRKFGGMASQATCHVWLVMRLHAFIK